MIDTYLSIKAPTAARITRKKSRFIGLLYPASNKQEVEALLAQAKRNYHDATHHCSAYRLAEDSGLVTHADDAGEPAGSAGKPILQQLEAADLTDVLAVVVRYFGGSKLGVGGLIRAYADATKEAIAAAALVEIKRRTRLSIRFSPELSSRVMSLLHRHPIEIEQVSYNEEARVLVAVPPSLLGRFSQELQEATGARARIEEET